MAELLPPAFPDRPWLEPLDGESVGTWIARLGRICTSCGEFLGSDEARKAHLCMGPGDEGLPLWLSG